jgi:hypothetical protein
VLLDVNVLTADVVALPPLHRYDAPVPAVSVTLPQPVDVPVMFAVGLLFTVTEVDVEAVHPLAPVTVTEYVPLVVNVLAAVVVLLPPLQR